VLVIYVRMHDVPLASSHTYTHLYTHHHHHHHHHHHWPALVSKTLAVCVRGACVCEHASVHVVCVCMCACVRACGGVYVCALTFMAADTIISACAGLSGYTCVCTTDRCRLRLTYSLAAHTSNRCGVRYTCILIH